MSSIYDFEVQAIDGEPRCLDAYRGQVLLIVNLASRCAFTPQYEGLEALHQKYHGRGLVVLGFPCNEFGNQEPGGDQAIKAFCQRSYGVTFPLFAKVAVNGPDSHPLYDFLKSSRRGFLGMKRIKWNFTKFLVDRTGSVIRRYAPITKPSSIEGNLQRLL